MSNDNSNKNRNDNKRIDKIAPKLTNSTPENNKKSVSVDSNIKFSFNEEIKKGDGNVVITDGIDTRTISITDSQVQISGKTLIINPSEDLHPNSNYTVKISSGSVTDLAGNSYVSTKNPLSFITKTAIVKPVELPKDEDSSNNLSDKNAPAFVSAKVNGNALTMKFDDVNPLSLNMPELNAFSILVDGVANPVSDIFINPNAKTVALLLDNPVLKAQNVTVSYNDATTADDVNVLQDKNGNDVSSFKLQTVTNNTLATVITKPTEQTKLPVLVSGANVSIDEGKTITFKVSSDTPAPAEGLNIPYKLSGTASETDYTLEKNSEIRIPAGEKTGLLVVNIANDNLTEGSETLVFSPIGALNSTLVTINDTSLTPIPKYTASSDVATIDEGKSIVVTVASDIIAPSGGLKIPYTLAGTTTVDADYTGSSAIGNLIIPEGLKTASITLNTINDVTTEGAETIIFSSELTNSATITVNDTSIKAITPKYTLSSDSITSGVNEGSSVKFTVTSDTVAPKDGLTIAYSLTGTTTIDTDYTGGQSTGNIIIPENATSASLTLNVIADTTTETTETIIFVVGSDSLTVNVNA